jgi:hypothetical protein
MGDFAEHLIERQVVSPEQLERALKAKRLYGGRLGSNLVETGALEVAELTGRLSEFLGVPPPPASWLTERSPEAEQAVPSALVQRHKIVPLRVEKRTLHVAALDPRDAGLRAALAEATDLQLEVWVLPELRVYSLLGKRYGIRRERSVSLSQLAEQARMRREARAPAAAPEPDPEQEQRRALGIAPLEAGEELVGETFFSDLHAQHMPGNDGVSAAAPGASPAALDDSLFEPIEPAAPVDAEAAVQGSDPHELDPAPLGDPATIEPPTAARACLLEAAIASAADRASLIDGVLELTRAHAESAAFFVIDDGGLLGQRAVIDGAPRQLDGVRLPCREESSLGRPVVSGRAFRGAPAGPADEPLLEALGRSEICQLAVLPIRLGDLTVAVLYVDGGEHPIADTSFAALQALCSIASKSWERLTLGQGR